MNILGTMINRNIEEWFDACNNRKGEITMLLFIKLKRLRFL